MLMAGRNASDVAFAWEFQVNAAIVLFVKNIEEAKSLRVEGRLEDIEIDMDDGTVIYAQAKARAHNDPGRGSTSRLDGALQTFADDATEKNYRSLVYVTNDDFPFGKDNSVPALQGGGTLRFAELPPAVQDFIRQKGMKYELSDIEYEAMEVSVIGFFGDDRDTRHKHVRRAIRDFLSGLGLGSRSDVNDGLLRDQWGILLHENAGTRDVKSKLSKEEFVWPIIVMLCGSHSDDKFFEDYDEDTVQDVVQQYKAIIDYHSERFEFITKAYSDFDAFKKEREGTRASVRKDFSATHWRDYVSDLGLDEINDDETREVVSRLVIEKLLKRKDIVKTIKVGVNLDN